MAEQLDTAIRVLQRTHVDSRGNPEHPGTCWGGVLKPLLENSNNCQIIKCIRDDPAHWGVEKEVLLMGDFNGHIQPLDRYQDANGSLMLQLAEELSLGVANLHNDCESVFTWYVRKSKSITP